MKLSDTAIQRPIFTWMMMIALILFGTLSFKKMGVSLLPDVDMPVVSVSLTLEGAAPVVMETQVVDPVESALLSVQGVKSIYSSAKQGSARVTLELELDKDIDTAVQEVQTVLAQVQRRLPDDVEPPVVRKRNPEDRPILWLSAGSSKMQARELMEFVRDRLKDAYTTIDGVSEVFLGGYVDPNLRVWLNTETLNKYSLTVSDILNTIKNEHQELPAGRIETPEIEKSVRVIGEAQTTEEFKKLVIGSRGGSPNFIPLTLGKVSEVEDGLADVRRISRTNGHISVGIGILKERGSNAVQVAKAVKEKTEELKKQLPSDVEIGINYDSTNFIEESLDELLFTLVLSALLTGVVCWFFLGSWSATFNILLAIPTSVVGSFIVLRYMNFTLNTFTVLGLSLAIGIVVDDAIMVLENIVRYLEKGKSRMDAALIGTREIAFAALAATIAIIAIFLPVAFMEGVIGRYFFEFGVTISVAVALSLFEALTLTPMRCAQFLETSGRSTRIGAAFSNFLDKATVSYAHALRWVLSNRWKVLFISVVLFMASMVSILFLRREFTPTQDQGLLIVNMKAPEGTALDRTNQLALTVEQWVSHHPAVARVFSSVGGFGGEVNTATMFVTMKEKQLRPHYTQASFAAEIRKQFKTFKDARVFVQEPSSGGLGGRRGYPVELTIRGPDWDELVLESQKFMKLMEELGTLTDINSDYVEGAPEIKVLPNREQAARYGVSISEIGETLNALIGGVVAGLYTKDGTRYDIRVRLREQDRNRIEDLNRIFVRNNRGELIPLSRIVDVHEGTSPQTISRADRARAIGISANLAEGASQSKVIEEIRKLASEKLPKGYYAVMTGSSQEFEDSFSELYFALMLGFLVSYMVLASQFNSLLHPLTVLMALPFSFSGAFLALWASNQSLNIYSMIGLILLMGICKKNSILLVDFTNQSRARGLGVRESLLEACPLRLRPILMTSFSTIAAALPAAINFGPGAESRMPMAVAIIGGMLVSTVLTLFVVPSVYSLLSFRSKEV